MLLRCTARIFWRSEGNRDGKAGVCVDPFSAPTSSFPFHFPFASPTELAAVLLGRGLQESYSDVLPEDAFQRSGIVALPPQTAAPAYEIAFLLISLSYFTSH